MQDKLEYAMPILLNCDLGESYGAWRMGSDSEVMPYIDQANIACGFHGGDPLTIQSTLQLAKEHTVSAGAHPSYPDLVGFGRRSMKCSENELAALLCYQMSALDGMAQQQGIALDYVKPHGALYNDMMASSAVWQTLLSAVANYHRPLKLMILSTDRFESYRSEAQQKGVDVLLEAFADRNYEDDGSLTPRSHENALLTEEETLERVRRLKEHNHILSRTGNILSFPVDSLCVHGDNPTGRALIQQIRQILQS